MSFQLVTGTMGGGKTYNVVKKCLKAFKDGAIVHSNIDWNEEALKAAGYWEQHVTLGDDPSLWIDKIKAGAEGKENVLAIDESAMIFHVWDQTQSRSRDRVLFDTLVMSRKLGLEVYFITQHEDNVAVPIRRMANNILRCVAVKNLPILGPFMATLKGDFLLKTLSNETLIEQGREFVRYDKAVSAFYYTDAKKGKAKEIPVEVTRRTENKPRNAKIVYVIMLCGISGIGYIGYRVYSIKNYTTEAQNKKKKEEEAKNVVSTLQTEQTIAQKIAQPFKAINESSQEEMRQTQPERHPFNARSQTEKAYGLEFDISKVRVIVSVIKSSKGIRVYTDGGDTWFPGKPTPDGRVRLLYAYNDEFLAETTTGEQYYLRRRTWLERRELTEWIIRINQEKNKHEQIKWNPSLQNQPPS